MNKRQEKILEYATQIRFFQTKDLMKFFRWSYDVERITLIRDLSHLVDQWLLEKTWKWRATKYQIPSNYRIIEQTNIEKYFSLWYKQRDIQQTFNFTVFDVLNWEIFSHSEKELLGIYHRLYLSNISKYSSQTIINKEYERIMIEFSWKSSAIEGNTYSLLNTEALIKENIADETKSKEETQMILNHKDAFNETIQNRERFLDLKLWDIEYLHTVLTKWLWIESNIRKEWVWITWTKYRPLDNEFQIKEALEKMINVIQWKEDFFEKSFLSLILLSYIQAFEDGNKRTSRMISNAILLAHGAIPLSYRIVDVVEYKKACILFYEQNNISYFKKIFIEQIADAVDNYFV